MNKKAQPNISLSGILMAIGVVLIVIGTMTWNPIAYFGIVVFVTGLAIKMFMNI